MKVSLDSGLGLKERILKIVSWSIISWSIERSFCQFDDFNGVREPQFECVVDAMEILAD